MGGELRVVPDNKSGLREDSPVSLFLGINLPFWKRKKKKGKGRREEDSLFLSLRRCVLKKLGETEMGSSRILDTKLFRYRASSGQREREREREEWRVRRVPWAGYVIGENRRERTKESPCGKRTRSVNKEEDADFNVGIQETHDRDCF